MQQTRRNQNRRIEEKKNDKPLSRTKEETVTKTISKYKNDSALETDGSVHMTAQNMALLADEVQQQQHCYHFYYYHVL